MPGESVTATVMVDARLQEPSVSRTADPLLADLLRRGEIAEEVLVDDGLRAAQHGRDPGPPGGRGD